MVEKAYISNTWAVNLIKTDEYVEALIVMLHATVSCMNWISVAVAAWGTSSLGAYSTEH